MTLLVSKEYFDGHFDEYDVAKARTRIGERYSRVFLCTLSKAKHLKHDALVMFKACNSFEYRDTAVIDEAGRVSCSCFSQVLPVLDNFKRLIVCGDPKQGAPYSSKNRTLSSVITVLEKRAKEKGIVKRGFLNIQYRLEMDIGALVSRTFYDGKVESYLKRSGKNLFFHDVRGEIDDRNRSISCNEEAELAMKYARRILHLHRNSTVAILCYYRFQMMKVSALRDKDNFGRRLIVSTVDGYQGKEAEYVIVSTCAQKFAVSGHVGERERTNVAISRGRRRLIVLGNGSYLKNDNLWSVILCGMEQVGGSDCYEAAYR